MLRNMEGSLTARDRVGIQDFVLLDAYTSESAFLDNLRKRFHENLIYVSILCRVSFCILIKLRTLDLRGRNASSPSAESGPLCC